MFRKLKAIRLQMVLWLIVILLISVWANLNRSSAANETSMAIPSYSDSETTAVSATNLKQPVRTYTGHQGKPTSPKAIEVFTVDDHLTLVLRLESQLTWPGIAPSTPSEWPTQIFQIATFGDQTQPGDPAGISGSLSLVDALDRYFVLYLKIYPTTSDG